MKSLCYPLVALALLTAHLGLAQTTPSTPERPLVVSPTVGETIDRAEKSKFGLFMFYSADEFGEATFYRALSADSVITLRVRLADGRTAARPYTQAEFLAVRSSIERRLKELGETVIKAPALAAGTPAAPMSAPDYPFQLGQSYRLETQDGTFSGVLTTLSLTNVELTTPDGTKVSVPRRSLLRVLPADGSTPAAARLGANRPGNYYDIGNGNRVFFSPTGRGLRKNEAVLQDIDLYLLGFNYGITDYFSLGGYISIVPGIDISDQLLVLTPKLSFPVNESLHIGAGVLYARIPDTDGTGAGVGYGIVTYGGADNNISAGLGYGFVNNDVGSTPVILLSGQRRITRRVSLLSENYIIADANAGMAGLYGMKLGWRRTSLSLGAFYAYSFGYTGSDPNPITTYILPVYIDFAFRFGKGARQPEVLK